MPSSLAVSEKFYATMIVGKWLAKRLQQLYNTDRRKYTKKDRKEVLNGQIYIKRTSG